MRVLAFKPWSFHETSKDEFRKGIITRGFRDESGAIDEPWFVSRLVPVLYSLQIHLKNPYAPGLSVYSRSIYFVFCLLSSLCKTILFILKEHIYMKVKVEVEI